MLVILYLLWCIRGLNIQFSIQSSFIVCIEILYLIRGLEMIFTVCILFLILVEVFFLSAGIVNVDEVQFINWADLFIIFSINGS